MANTTPNNISYPTNASAKKTFEGHIQDTADSVQTALNTKANLSGAAFTGNVTVSSSGTVLNGSNGTGTFISSSSGKVPIVSQGASGQTANLQEWQNSSGAVVANIDATGRIFAPNQPSFYVATALSPNPYTTVGTIPFNTIILNNGNCYNSSTGRFTAPVAGYYFITSKNMNEVTDGTRLFLYIMKNGVQYMGLFGPTNYGGMAVGSCVMYLNVGDYATVYLRAGGIFGSGGTSNTDTSQFSGFLIG